MPRSTDTPPLPSIISRWLLSWLVPSRFLQVKLLARVLLLTIVIAQLLLFAKVPVPVTLPVVETEASSRLATKVLRLSLVGPGKLETLLR